jgi:MinD superfamily P-loop ATPase
MEKIVSTGVKGGVGKSTFAILLGFKLSNQGKKVVLCDCDVECPNDYLILGKKLKNLRPIYKEFPVLDKEKCTKCGLCSETCKYNAIFWVKDKYPVFVYDLCSSCRACMIVCPVKAIKLKKKIVGESYINKINDNFWLVTGVSKPRILDIVPIVGDTKDRAMKLAKEENADYLIIDTAPGTHCNVIQALLNSDRVYAVTEPTPLGSHDLGLILELVKKLNIPAEIVLNKSDVGNRKEIENIAKKFNKKISIEIPYSEELVKAYCNKKLEKVVNLI